MHRGDLSLALRAAGVDDMQDQVRLGHLLEGRAKRRDQRVRQAIDEADGVGHEQLTVVGEPYLTDQRIEGDEQRV